jgi:hypothetical protein
MALICIKSLLDFCQLFVFVFSLGCVYLSSHFPSTFDGWVPILDLYLHGFSYLTPFEKIMTNLHVKKRPQ